MKATRKEPAPAADGIVAPGPVKRSPVASSCLRSLPVKTRGELPVIPVDERAAEVRAIKVG